MTQPLSAELFRQAASLIRSASYAVVFTGAGVSTPSGIPDFRSARSGLWNQYDPMQSASLSTFRQQPEKFYEWFSPLATRILAAVPNPAHLAIAQLQQMRLVKVVITQNIDGLHQAAGSNDVIELHGSVASFSCPHCHKKTDAQLIRDALLDGKYLPICGHCSSVLKPDVVLFEEMLPEKAWERAVIHCARADLVLIVGSSLEVMPAARLPAAAAENGAKLIICNHSPTFLDSQAKLLLPHDVAVSLPEIVNLLK